MNPCEPCKTITECLQFPLVFYNLNVGKHYINPTLGFQIVCPNGSVVTQYVAAGTVQFTLPFPPGFTGDYPPLVLGCAAGGNIVRSIPSGATQDQIDAIVNEMIFTCAKAIAEQQANCNAPNPVANDVVYFNHPCSSGTLTLSVTPPSWITLDAGNSRLVGAAGTFTSNSKSAANALAQAALNGYGNQQLGLGTLTCSVPCVALQGHIAEIAGGFASITDTKSAATRRIVGYDSLIPALNFINSQTETNIANPVLSAMLSFTPGCFATSNQHFYFASQNHVFVYDKDGTFIKSIVIPQFCSNPIYSPTQDKVYVDYFDGISATIIGTIDPATDTLSSTTSLGVNYNLAYLLYYPDKLVLDEPGNPNYRVHSLPGFGLFGSVNMGPGGKQDVMAFAVNTAKIFVAAFNAISFDAEVWEIDPVTLAVGSVYAMPVPGDGIESLTYNSVTGKIIATTDFGSLVVLDPVSHTIVCSISVSNGSALGCDLVSGHIYKDDEDTTNIDIFF